MIKKQTNLVAILNVTPDSFSDGGLFFSPDSAADRFYDLISQGADIVDIGAESTRPNAKLLDDQEEWDRLKPVLDRIFADIRFSSDTKKKISIDTRKFKIAQKVMNEGIYLINDVSAASSVEMLLCISQNEQSKIILSHNRGIPADLKYAKTNNIYDEVIDFFENKLIEACSCGVKKSQIILDFGFGFGKNVQENIELFNSILKIKDHFEEFPFMVGLSRKRFVKNIWGESFAEEGSLILNVLAMQKNVEFIRTHNVQSLSKLKMFH